MAFAFDRQDPCSGFERQPSGDPLCGAGVSGNPDILEDERAQEKAFLVGEGIKIGTQSGSGTGGPERAFEVDGGTR